jgi:hypothetical protein
MAGNAPTPGGLMAARPWWRERSLYIAVVLWIACICAIYPISGGTLPFNRPNIGALSFR